MILNNARKPPNTVNGADSVTRFNSSFSAKIAIVSDNDTENPNVVIDENNTTKDIAAQNFVGNCFICWYISLGDECNTRKSNSFAISPVKHTLVEKYINAKKPLNASDNLYGIGMKEWCNHFNVLPKSLNYTIASITGLANAVQFWVVDLMRAIIRLP